MRDLVWRFIAFVVSRRAVADYLIRRAQRTPYFHLPGYMNRWWLFNGYSSDQSLSEGERGNSKRFAWLPSIRVHHILREDLASHMHDHPWNARTIILRGDYTERRLERGLELEWEEVTHERRPGSTARVLFGEFHHIERVSTGGVFTLFFSWKYAGGWGFLVNGRKVPWRQYVTDHPERA